MIKNIALLTIMAFIIFTASPILAQEMGFEEYNPTSTLVVPGKEITKAKFPFIDVHRKNKQHK